MLCIHLGGISEILRAFEDMSHSPSDQLLERGFARQGCVQTKPNQSMPYEKFNAKRALTVSFLCTPYALFRALLNPLGSQELECQCYHPSSKRRR